MTTNLPVFLMLAFGLGLLGFIEPCSIGAHLVFARSLQGKGRAEQLAHTATFALSRALFLGLLGALVAFVGTTFLDLQRGFWLVLGTSYAALGLLYLAGKQGAISRALGTRFTGEGRQGALTLGLLLGFNIPACAAPLLAALLGATLGAATVTIGFVTLAVFGFALSLPLLIAVFWEPARSVLNHIATRGGNVPRWTGFLFVVLGIWSIYLAFRA
ncbi:MAG: hypothetical protein H0T92_17380 [Pyrinomonadaceae bacterium]|nr:hypothetical protein [Pyrinomonadaceae bacterium]